MSGSVELLPNNVELASIIRNGVLENESALFKYVTVVRERLERIIPVISTLEQKIFDPTFLELKTDRELVALYTLFSNTAQQLTDYLHLIHNLTANMAKYEFLKDYLNKEQPTINKTEVSTDKLKNVIYLVEAEMKKRDRSS